MRMLVLATTSEVGTVKNFKEALYRVWSITKKQANGTATRQEACSASRSDSPRCDIFHAGKSTGVHERQSIDTNSGFG